MTLLPLLNAYSCDNMKPRLLSDNGSSYVSGELAEWLDDKNIGHVRGAPYQPQTQGKIASQHLLRNCLTASGDGGTRP